MVKAIVMMHLKRELKENLLGRYSPQLCHDASKERIERYINIVRLHNLIMPFDASKERIERLLKAEEQLKLIEMHLKRELKGFKFAGASSVATLSDASKERIESKRGLKLHYAVVRGCI